MGEAQSHQWQHLTTLRSLLVEVHVNMLLHAVKATRIALRCSDLTKGARNQALQSLDVREQLVRQNINEITERFELSSNGMLSSFLSGGLLLQNHSTGEPDTPV